MQEVAHGSCTPSPHTKHPVPTSNWLAQLWRQLRLLTPLPPGVTEVRYGISRSILYVHLTVHSANCTAYY